MEFQQLPSFEGIHFGGLSMFGKSQNRSIIFFTSAPPCFWGCLVTYTDMDRWVPGVPGLDSSHLDSLHAGGPHTRRGVVCCMKWVRALFTEPRVPE